MLKIYFISDRTLTPSEPPARPMLGAIAAGVEMVQIREKDLPAREVLSLAREVVAAAPEGGAEVFVNSRFDVALAAGAGGVHLPASGLRPSDVRRACGGRLAIGASTHTLDEARAAEAEGASFITFGPIFETPSKARFGPPVGMRALHAVLGSVSIPVFAIGGIGPDNVGQVAELPVSGVAVISAIARAGDRREAVEAIRSAAMRARGGAA